jgi:hypothetical protein
MPHLGRAGEGRQRNTSWQCAYTAKVPARPRRCPRKVCPGAAPRVRQLRERSALTDPFDLDLQFHVLLESILVAEVDTEVTAVDRRRRIGAAHFLL